MSAKFVVGYDGSVAARRALDFAVERARPQGGTIVLAHVLEWSPYSFLTPDERNPVFMRRLEHVAAGAGRGGDQNETPRTVRRRRSMTS